MNTPSGSNIHFKINERAMYVNWANRMENYLVSSIVNKRLTDTYQLKNSVKMSMMGITTDIKTFVFRFALKGMFVDMGLFGGKGLNEKAEDAFVRRLIGKRAKRNKGLKNRTKKQYQWYSRTMFGGVDHLGREVMALYGNQASAAFNLPSIIEL